MKTFATVLPLLLAPALFAQSAPLSASTPTKGTAVRVAGTSVNNLSVTRIKFQATPTESAPLLSGIELLGIEIAGRTPISDLAGSTGRIVEVANGVVAAQLPGPQSIRVFHYRKPALQLFGFFALRGDGELQILIERQGLGPAKNVDPFDPVIGVARDGTMIAIAASDPKSGPTGLGDAWLVRADGGTLPSGSFIAELTGAAALEVVGTSLTFFGGFVYAATDAGLERAPLTGSGPFTPVAVPPSGGNPASEVTAEFVVSEDGSTLAFLAGSQETQVDLYRVDTSGLVTNISQQPQSFVDPGFLPETPDGPHLALSSDGSVVVYQLDLAAGNEMYVRPFSVGSTPHQLTQDQEFDHSIDQMSGILTGGSFVRFLAASGQQNADLYRSSLPVGGTPQLKNLTQTSGSPDPWFPNAATMQVSAQANLRGGRLIVDDQTVVGGSGRILRFSGATDATGVVASNLVADPHVVAASNAPSTLAIATTTAASTTLFAYDGVNAPNTLLQLPPGFALDSLAARDGGFVYGFVVDAGSFGDYVVQVAAQGAALAVVPGSPYVNARDVLYARNGKLLFVADGPAGVAQTFIASNSPGPAQPAGAAANVAFWLR